MTPTLATALIALLGALTAYIKSHTENIQIKIDREQTKKDRDKTNELLTYRLSQCEKRLEGNDPKLDKIMDMLNSIRTELASTTAIVNEMRTK
jgi:hypothetical protein